MSKPGTNISASSGMAIILEDHYPTAYAFYQKKMWERDPKYCIRQGWEPILPPTPEQQFMFDLGHAFEDSICELAERECPGYTIGNREEYFTMAIGDESEAITAHFDGIYRQVERPAEIIHEGKTTNPWSWRKNFRHETDDQPQYVSEANFIQVHHQGLFPDTPNKTILSVLVLPKRQQELYDLGYRVKEDLYGKKTRLRNECEQKVINASNWAETWYDTGDFHQYHIEHDETIKEMMLERYHNFWNKSIIGGEPPALSDYEDCKKALPPDNRFGYIQIPENQMWHIEGIQEIKSEMKILKKREEKLKCQMTEIVFEQRYKERLNRLKKLKRIRRAMLRLRRIRIKVYEAQEINQGSSLLLRVAMIHMNLTDEYYYIKANSIPTKKEIDAAAKEKIIFEDETGEEIATFDKKSFRWKTKFVDRGGE